MAPGDTVTGTTVLITVCQSVRDRAGTRSGRRTLYIVFLSQLVSGIVQELCESRGGRPGLSVLTSLLFSVDIKLY